MNMEILKDPVFIWFLIGLFCVITEFALPGVIIVFFGAGAWAVSLLVYFFDINVALQVVIFIITSLAALITLRKKFNPSDEDDKADITDDFIGKIAVVEEAVSKGRPGRVIFKGAGWKAKTLSEEVLEQGSYVKIIRHESIVLYVEPFNE